MFVANLHKQLIETLHTIKQYENKDLSYKQICETIMIEYIFVYQR